MAQTSKATRAGDEARGGLRQLLSPRLFKALCDPSRLALVLRLAELGAPTRVSEIAECCPLDLSVVSRHLAQLREAGVVEAERLGKEVRYRLRVHELIRVLRAIADALESCCKESRCTDGGAGCCGTATRRRTGKER